MWRAPVLKALALLLLYSLSAGARSAGAASFLDPRLGFHVLVTAHFVIYFHQGEENPAARLSAIAEQAWRQVSASLASPAPQRTHVILADQTDLANGWANPLPRNTIFVTAAAPAGSDFIGRTDDWLRLVFTHEFTHIVHLDRSGGWARVVRGVFGRTPLAFPNLLLPVWQIEGLASFEESAITGEGRLHAGDFRMIEREAARTGRFEPLDRLNGGLIDWPDGLGAYAYGLGFHQYLADRFGAASFGELGQATARRLPFLGSRAFRAVYGESLGSLWARYRAGLEAQAAAPPSRSAPEIAGPASGAARLTRDGQIVTGPRFVPTCSGCPATIVYSARNPDGFPSLRSVAADGSQAHRLADRYLGATIGRSADVIVFDQLEWRRDTGVYSDLYALDRHTGQLQALTRESRVQDPDLSPDGRTIAGVREQRGRRDLVLLPLGPDPGGRRPPALMPDRLPAGDGALRWTAGPVTRLISEPDTWFNAPRWSPDGASVAVERQRLGALSEIVVVDVASVTIRTIASDPSTRFVTPTWRPDGRRLIAAADYNEGSFDLYEFPADSNPSSAGRRLTALAGGATWPDVSSDGATIVFVGYTTDGFDLFTIPYSPAAEGPDTRESSLPAVVAPAAAAPPRTAVAVPTSAVRYSPLSTLVPTSWTPIVEIDSNQIRAGVGTAAADVLARHAYAASATWLVDGPRDAAAADGASPDWSVGYAYDRWRPILFSSASSSTAFGAGPPDQAGRSTSATLRSVDFEAGVLYPVRHVRATHRALASIVRTTDHYTFADHVESRTRTGARVGWGTSTARTYGYSISQEDGLSAGGTAEFAAGDGSAAGGATSVTADARVYVRGLKPRQVLAIRAAAGASYGDRDSQRIFHLGGSGPNRDVLDFGREAVSLLRGFPSDAFAGTRVAAVNAEYRFPIARPQRGVGTLPLMLRAVHAALFADTAHAWTRALLLRDIKVAAGGELSLDLFAAYSVPLTMTAGAAWGHDGANAARGGTLYLRFGRAF